MKKLTITAVKMLLVSIVVTGVALFISACSNEDLITPSTEGVFDGKEIRWFVEGTVYDTSGPYEGAKVEVIHEDLTVRITYTREDGWYIHSGLHAYDGEDLIIKASLRTGEYKEKPIYDFQPGGYVIDFYFP